MPAPDHEEEEEKQATAGDTPPLLHCYLPVGLECDRIIHSFVVFLCFRTPAVGILQTSGIM
ncbi:hypothetical protein HispidOSU_024342, partial [Sigmodon hispidus]